MTKQELETDLQGLVAHANQISGAINYIRQKIAMLDKQSAANANGKVGVPRHDVSIGDEEVHHQIAAEEVPIEAPQEA